MGKTRDLFKKIGDNKGILHAKIGKIKDKNSKDLMEAEEIKKRRQEYTEELYKRALNDSDNHSYSSVYSCLLFLICILSLCLFYLYADCIIQNAGLDDAQAEIKITRRNMNNLSYADDTTLMAQSEEQLKTS